MYMYLLEASKNEQKQEKGHNYMDIKQARILVYIPLRACAITVLHERWMQDTPTLHCVTW